MRMVLLVVWLLTVTAGMAMLMNYQAASGSPGVTPARWPGGRELSLDQARPTLVLFAHPKCPCTRAAIEQLNRILAKHQNRVSANVVFLEATGDDGDWAGTGLWRSVSAIPGIKVQQDDGGKLAERFGAETSGFVVLYHPKGHVLFSGGITAGRGHAGDNAGADALAALLAGEKSLVTETAVYGCALSNEPRVRPAENHREKGSLK